LLEDYKNGVELHADLEKATVKLREDYISKYAETGTTLSDTITDPTVPNGSPQKHNFTS
jgi:hypothetical protein